MKKKLLAIGIISMFSCISYVQATEHYMYVGTYTAPNYAPGGKVPSTAKGIYVFKTKDDGSLHPVQEISTPNPSYLCFSSDKNFLYAANELGQDKSGNYLGEVSSFKVNKKTGQLTFVNKQFTNGTWPTYCSVHPSGKYLFAANYGSGTYPVYALNKDGSIGKMVDFKQAQGNGLGSEGARQENAHAHQIVTSPNPDYVMGVDLAGDEILVWKIDVNTGKLSPAPVPTSKAAAGTGPRHIIFSKDKKYMFALNELSSTIDVFDFDQERGSTIWKQTISTLPSNGKYERVIFDPTNPGKVTGNGNTTAEIRLHPSGKWLFATNRGMNSVVKFDIGRNGNLYHPAWVTSGGEIPRGMNISPDGKILYVGNQNSDLVYSYKINQDSGVLEEVMSVTKTPVPVDFVFGNKID